MFEYVVPCLFGLEGPAAEELRRMGLENVRAENGRVRFSGDDLACAKANLCLRTGERVLLSLGTFEAKTFDQLFEGVRALPWADFIPRDGAFPVKGYSLSSALHSVPDCQKIVKKAVSRALGERYHIEWLPETGALYQIQFSLQKDRAELYLDTTGAPLFKRGYRPGHVAAPLRETLAAALVGFSRYRGRELFCDPLCGSGTIAIEAALIAHNRAPGLHRDFSAKNWVCFDQKAWIDAAAEAKSLEYPGPYHILASDIDPAAVSLARENAARAVVSEDITFSVSDARSFAPPSETGLIVTNPPYGERMLEKERARTLLRELGEGWRGLSGFQKSILSVDTELERLFGQTAAKKRKLYNGMLQCWLYLFPGQ